MRVRGYLTVYLALSLTVLSGFILMLTTHAVKKSGKLRTECAADTAVNAVLSEFNVNLYERYGLLYIDASYLGRTPEASNIEERLWGYLVENTDAIAAEGSAPWGSVRAQQAVVERFETAAALEGASMRSQAIMYAQDTGIEREEAGVLSHAETIQRLNESHTMEDWSGIMGQIAGIELPIIINEEGEEEEVPLSNPADWVFGLSGSDLMYLGEPDMQGIGAFESSLSNYLSHRQVQNVGAQERTFYQEKELFLGYLFEKLGYYQNFRSNSFFNCQLEYVAIGQNSDWKNMQETVSIIFKWRFADNAKMALSDGALCGQAQAAANELHAVRLKEEFREPVTLSILYACAFLESVSDIKTILSGGRIPLQKSAHRMNVEYLLAGTIYRGASSGGWSYSQYLAGILCLLNDKTLNFRTMDIMEMDIRRLDGNESFAMDWCAERLEIMIETQNSYGNRYSLKRKYGYF